MAPFPLARPALRPSPQPAPRSTLGSALRSPQPAPRSASLNPPGSAPLPSAHLALRSAPLPSARPALHSPLRPPLSPQPGPPSAPSHLPRQERAGAARWKGAFIESKAALHAGAPRSEQARRARPRSRRRGKDTVVTQTHRYSPKANPGITAQQQISAGQSSFSVTVCSHNFIGFDFTQISHFSQGLAAQSIRLPLWYPTSSCTS